MEKAKGSREPRWSRVITDRSGVAEPFVVGVFEGEGIGSEVIGATLRVLAALQEVIPERLAVRMGGAIGLAAEAQSGAPLSATGRAFCEEVFAQQGAILAGPGGGRFVYDIRKRFDLFCKLSPVRSHAAICHVGRLKTEWAQNLNILFVRDNAGGVYQGEWSESQANGAGRRAEHRFWYTERDVRRLLVVAAQLARHRRGLMTVVVKEGGVPTITKLWIDCAREEAAQAGVQLALLNIDYAAYYLLQHAQELDVVVAPNLFGDILADLAGVLLGSRALTYGASYSATGAAVYQTNHGGAHALAGTDRANPVGQILSLALLLHESFGLTAAARRIEAAVDAVWRAGWRTDDLAEPGCRRAGTRAMGELVAEAVVKPDPLCVTS